MHSDAPSRPSSGCARPPTSGARESRMASVSPRGCFLARFVSAHARPSPVDSAKSEQGVTPQISEGYAWRQSHRRTEVLRALALPCSHHTLNQPQSLPPHTHTQPHTRTHRRTLLVSGHLYSRATCITGVSAGRASASTASCSNLRTRHACKYHQAGDYTGINHYRHHDYDHHHPTDVVFVVARAADMRRTCPPAPRRSS